MFGKRRLQAEIVRLTYRVAELEERICPCESHDWKEIGKEYTMITFGEIDTLYYYKCRKCGKTMKKYDWQ